MGDSISPLVRPTKWQNCGGGDSGGGKGGHGGNGGEGGGVEGGHGGGSGGGGGGYIIVPMDPTALQRPHAIQARTVGYAGALVRRRAAQIRYGVCKVHILCTVRYSTYCSVR